MSDRNKAAAAIAAVMSYLQSEEEALCLQAVALSQAGPQPPAPAPQAPANLWGAGGRQALMQMRTLMQMKSFHTLPPR
jgi:hypothetical protein